MQMIKGSNQFNMLRHQHTIAEYIASHIANTDNSKIVLLGIKA